MIKDQEVLNTYQVRDMFLYVADRIIESEPILTKIDSQIGDGDHGIGMRLGFTKVKENLTDKQFSTINDIFKTIGMSLISTMGGASGIIFGTMFLGGIKDIDLKNELDLETLSNIFETSLRVIKVRGKAKLGEKTMIDSFEPAVEGLIQCVAENRSILDGIKLAEELAAKGVEDTKKYVAAHGRAKSLGKRAIGFQDPGATTVYIIFRSMREWIENFFCIYKL